MLVQARLCAWKVSKAGFHLQKGPVKLVQAYLSFRKDLERSFHHCGGPVKLSSKPVYVRERPDQSVLTSE